MSTGLSSPPLVVLYCPKARRFAKDSGSRRPSDKLRPCLVTAVDGDRIRVAPCITAKPGSKIKPSSWSPVDYGEHGPAIPDHPLPNAPVFCLRLRTRKQHGWTATSCFVWTRDGGQWTTIAELGKKGKKKRRGVLDSDFDLSPEEVAGLRDMHKTIAGGN